MKFFKKITVGLFLSFLIFAPFISRAVESIPQMSNPIPSVSSPQLLIGKIINVILGVVGSIALIMFIYGGFTWMTAGGSAEGTKKGMNIIVWSVLGLAVIFLSYGLVKYLILNIK